MRGAQPFAPLSASPPGNPRKSRCRFGSLTPAPTGRPPPGNTTPLYGSKQLVRRYLVAGESDARGRGRFVAEDEPRESLRDAGRIAGRIARRNARGQKGAEVALAHRHRRDRFIQGAASARQLVFEAPEEEDLILVNWAAQEAAEVVEAQVGLFGIRALLALPRVGVELVVAEEFEERAVKIICAAPGNDVDGGAGLRSVFRAVGTRHQLELLD